MTDRDAATQSLAEQQRALSVRTLDLSTQWKSQPVASWLLQKTAANMSAVADRLQDADLGPATRTAQAGIRDELLRLAQLLQHEIDRRVSGYDRPFREGPKPSAEGADAGPVTLPRTEIVLLLQLQQELNRRSRQ